MELYAVNGSGALATSRTTSGTSAILTTSVSPQTYTLRLFHRGGCGSTGLCSTSFSLSVVRP
jgi:hypothetical protein